MTLILYQSVGGHRNNLSQIKFQQMGLTNSGTKVSIEEKLQFLETRVVKPCSYHSKECILYCAIPNCDKCPYLCQDCVKENIHQHQDGIHNHQDFIRAIVTLIEVKRLEQKQPTRSSMASNQDYMMLYKQQTKLMDHIDILQKQMRAILADYRSKLQTSLDRLSKGLQNCSSKSSTYINFYHNPNILVHKLASEQNDKFLLDLKFQLRSSKKPVSTINEEEYFAQLKTELGSVKSKIRDLLNVANLVTFPRKNTTSYSIVNPTLRKTFILSSECPTRMFLAGSSVNIGTSKEIFNVESSTKEVRKLLGQPVITLSSRSRGEEFIGILSLNKIIVYDCKSVNQISVAAKVSSVNILKHKRRLYGLLGEEEGTFNVVDLEQNKSVFSYRCADQPIIFVEICQANSTICCAGKKTGVFMFGYKSRYTADENPELEFEYALQMNAGMMPQGELQLMRTNNCELYLFGPCRNIVVFDLMLNTEIIRTEYIKKCGAFVEAQFTSLGDSEYMVTLNQNQDTVSLWNIDKIKRNLRVDELMKDKNEREIISIACVRGELWVIRDGQKNVDVFNLLDDKQ